MPEESLSSIRREGIRSLAVLFVSYQSTDTWEELWCILLNFSCIFLIISRGHSNFLNLIKLDFEKLWISRLFKNTKTNNTLLCFSSYSIAPLCCHLTYIRRVMCEDALILIQNISSPVSHKDLYINWKLWESGFN